ncbi:hypothetical protein [Geopsychrobacter electrodiphilus]|uniref:hypothetical protein n=1 Tax=Geopsychrobacter electrodiphilus TaxID=225196 RepID=UPI0012EBA34D|nr:hypothetical protein [Geopsychrobacter electrodiphilus]
MNNQERKKDHIRITSKAGRLLEVLNLPGLFLTSNPLNLNPKIPFSQKRGQIATEVHNFSRGRFSLAADQILPSTTEKFYRHQKLKVLHSDCNHYSWSSIAAIEKSGDRCCVHCYEPTDFSQIGNKREIQDYVLIRSQRLAYFHHVNEIWEIDDVYSFQCISCATPFEAPFSWFLRDSGPKSNQTNGCPSCEAKMKEFMDRNGQI